MFHGLQRGVAAALPGCDYYYLASFQLERRRICHPEVVVRGPGERARERGDFFAVDVIDQSILVVRGMTWRCGRLITSPT